MITANEVRIGNLLYGTHGKVSEVNIDAIKYLITYGGTNQCQVKPIPLTEEWLKRFGFEKVKNKIGVYEKGRLRIWLGSRGAFLVYLIEEDTTTGHHIPSANEYVHQLQNLYFALTQTELTTTNP